MQRREKVKSPIEIQDGPENNEELPTMSPSILMDSLPLEAPNPAMEVLPPLLSETILPSKEVLEQTISPPSMQQHPQEVEVPKSSQPSSLTWIEQSLMKKRKVVELIIAEFSTVSSLFQRPEKQKKIKVASTKGNMCVEIAQPLSKKNVD